MPALAKELREAVLQAAIQGKLTEQSSEDETAEELFIELQKAKKELIKNKAILAKQSTEPFYDEYPFDIPDNWKWVQLSDVSIIQEGAGIRKHQYTKSGTQLLSVTNILDGGIDLKKKEIFVSTEEYKQKYIHLTPQRGDIVTACSGGSWGKVAIFDRDESTMLNTSTLRMRFFKDIANNDYLYTLCKSDFFKNQLTKQLSGMQPNFGYAHYSRICFPLPPLNEQQRIVERIKELIGKIDEYEKIENQLVELQKKFPGEMKEALLQAAIQGKLTQSNEDDSYANELLVEIDRCKNDYVSARKIKGKELLPITQEDEENFELKPKWCLTRLGNLCTIIFMGKSPVYEKQKNGYLCIGQKNNQDNGFTTNGIKYVTKAFWESVPEYQHLRKNDVLLNTLGGGTVGRSGMYTIDDDAITDGHVMVIRFKDDATAKYVLTYLQLFRRFIEDSANGSTNQKFINLYDVKNYLIPLPPLSEQKRIVEKLEKLMNICDALNS